MANEFHSLLAKVSSGWTGTLTVTVGAATATVTPRSRTSALRVLERMVYEARRVHGEAFVAYVDSAAKFVVEMKGTTFSIAATGTTATKTGLTATQSGSDGYTFPTVTPDAIVPRYGARLSVAMAQRSKGATMLSGGTGYTKAAKSATGNLTLFDTLASASTFADTLSSGGTYDVGVMRTADATDVMTVERVRIRTSAVQRWNELGTTGRTICAIQGVSA